MLSAQLTVAGGHKCQQKHRPKMIYIPSTSNVVSKLVLFTTTKFTKDIAWRLSLTCSQFRWFFMRFQKTLQNYSRTFQSPSRILVFTIFLLGTLPNPSRTITCPQVPLNHVPETLNSLRRHEKHQTCTSKHWFPPQCFPWFFFSGPVGLRSELSHDVRGHVH